LSWRRHSSISIFAWARERNHSRLRHSSQNLPLKLFATPGLPGSINAVQIPCATIQRSSALDNPVRCHCAGHPGRRDRAQGATAFRVRRGADAAVDVDCQAFFGELVGHGQALELLTVGNGRKRSRRTTFRLGACGLPARAHGRGDDRVPASPQDRNEGRRRFARCERANRDTWPSSHARLRAWQSGPHRRALACCKRFNALQAKDVKGPAAARGGETRPKKLVAGAISRLR
jgi:hypothetical protein